MSCQLHHFQNVGDLAGNIVHGAAFQFLIDFAPERQIVGHPAVRREESTVGKDDFPAVQKFITEQRFMRSTPSDSCFFTASNSSAASWPSASSAAS